MVAWIVTEWVMVVPSLVPVAVNVMGKVPVVMGMKWSVPQAVVAVVRRASRARDRIARRAVRRLSPRPISEKKVRGKSAARMARVWVETLAVSV